MSCFDGFPALDGAPAPRRGLRISVRGTAAALMALVAACQASAGRAENAGGAAPEVVLGERLYAQRCASCHGAELEGQPDWKRRLPDGGMPAPPHDASGHTWHHGDQLLFEITKFGGQAMAPPGFKSTMPAFGAQLSDPEIRAVLAFIKSRWPAEIQTVQRERSLSPN